MKNEHKTNLDFNYRKIEETFDSIQLLHYLVRTTFCLRAFPYKLFSFFLFQCYFLSNFENLRAGFYFDLFLLHFLYLKETKTKLYLHCVINVLRALYCHASCTAMMFSRWPWRDLLMKLAS